MTKKRTDLFDCTENACRSQIAEALVNHFVKDGWEAVSARTEPVGRVDPRAVEALNEPDIDASIQPPRAIEHFRDHAFDVVVTVYTDAEQRFSKWEKAGIKQFIGFEDPSNYDDETSDPMEGYRRVRDEIRADILPFLRSTASGSHYD